MDAPVAVSVIDSPLQIDNLGAEILMMGGVIFLITITELCAIHPFGVALVIVKVYVPELLTIGVNVLAPETIFPPPVAVHKNVAPG
ncbi:hypothetical protein ACFOEQ_13985 [Chryseobacterium arachidis]|uniref:hypothetical protein n=1 Tax=Chryseobacterium arachidis TaxID=1416778 RepID=UPI00360F88D1